MRIFNQTEAIRAPKQGPTSVFTEGNFESAIDPSGNGLYLRESWDPFSLALPDEKMFDSMKPDVRYPLGVPHASDQFTFDLVPHLAA